MTQYLCSACKDNTGWCKNWDGTSTKDDWAKGMFKARAMDCKLDPATCGFHVIGKVHQPEEVNDGQNNG
jgi:hypothetical protein